MLNALMSKNIQNIADYCHIRLGLVSKSLMSKL